MLGQCLDGTHVLELTLIDVPHEYLIGQEASLLKPLDCEEMLLPARFIMAAGGVDVSDRLAVGFELPGRLDGLARTNQRMIKRRAAQLEESGLVGFIGF